MKIHAIRREVFYYGPIIRKKEISKEDNAYNTTPIKM
jgi:hypothetical protein